ncbi:MAG: MATE family efflux transporter [Salinivirgaceae bacterium]|nr:MAG: MATE family efflux transporter [Salinivirgaceae bacterium]
MLDYFKSYLPFYKRNLAVAIPVVLSQAGQMTVQLADNMMVGHVGTSELAAASFANSIYIVGFVLGLGLTFGATPLVGAAFGKNDFKGAASVLHHSFIGNGIVSLFLVAIMWGVSYLMPFMGQPESVVELAIPYYRLLVISIVPFMLFFTGKQFIEGIGNTSMAMKITLIANVINIGLNYLWIYGKLGFPAMGLMGAGYATLVSRVFMAIAFTWFMAKHKHFRRYFYLIDIKKFKLSEVSLFFRTGMPIGLQMLAEVTLFSLAAVMMGWIGEVPLAAHQIALNVSMISFMIATGIASGTTIRVSHQLGAKNFLEMRKAGIASLHLIIAFMSTTAVLFFTFRYQLPWMFTTDQAVIDAAAKLLIFSAIFQIFDGSQVVLLGSLRGLADVNKAFLLALLTYLIIGVPLMYVLGFMLDLKGAGIWTALASSLAMAAIFFYFRFKRKCRLLEK